MKKIFYLFAGLIFLLSGNVFAQYDDDEDDDVSFDVISDDDLPYLDDDDIAAIEAVLPEDTPQIPQAPVVVAEEKPANAGTASTGGANEMPRLNTNQTLYHLLVLDRTRCPNSDISGLQNIRVLYKYKHGRNGYLIAVYTSSRQGPVFPVLPANSRVMVDLVSSRAVLIKDYVNSSAFRRLVTNRRILSDIQRSL
jgi:hypothetical protein